MTIGDLSFISKVTYSSNVWPQSCVVDVEYRIVFVHMTTGYVNSYRYTALGALTLLDSKLGAGNSIGMAIDTKNKLLFTAKDSWTRSWTYDSDGIMSQNLYLNNASGQCYSLSIDNDIDFGGGNEGGAVFRGLRTAGIDIGWYYDDISAFWDGPGYNTAGTSYHSAADTVRKFVFLADSGQGLAAFKYTTGSISYVNVAGSGTMRGIQGVAIDTANRLVFVGNESTGLAIFSYDEITAAVSLIGTQATTYDARGIILDPTRMLCFIGAEGIYSCSYSGAGAITPIDVNLNLNNSGSPVEGIGIDTEWHLLFEPNGKSSIPATTGELRVLSYEVEPAPPSGGSFVEGYFVR